MIVVLVVAAVVGLAGAFFFGTVKGKADVAKAVAAVKTEFAVIEADAKAEEKAVVAKIKAILAKL